MEIVGKVEIELDSKVTTQDLTDIVESEAEEVLVLEREAIETNLRRLRKQHSAAEEKLTAEGEKLAKKTKLDSRTTNLVKALNVFHDNKKANAEVSEDSELDIAKCEVRITIQIWGKPKNERQSYSSPVFSRTVTTPFTKPMSHLVGDMEELSTEIAEDADKMTAVRRKLADLPRLVRRARAALTKAKLLGRLKTTGDLLAVLSTVESKALPALKEV